MPAATKSPSSDSEVGPTRTIGTGDLFGGASEVVIVHNGAQYRLRITRQDKLILTK